MTAALRAAGRSALAAPAHGIGGREDLPLPLGLTVTGAALAVVISFIALGLLWREQRLHGARAGRPLPAATRRVLDRPWTRRAVAAIGLLAFAWTLLALVFGRDDARNPAPWIGYVLLWVGLVPVSVLIGPLWRLANPIRTGHALVNRAMGLDPRDGIRPLPARLGWWPAAAGLLAFTWLELVAPDNATLPTLRWAMGLYCGTHLVAALVFGSTWFDRGDAFEAWSGLYGLVGPFGRRVDGTLVVRAPLVGLDALPPAPGLVATVAVMVGSTAYDGLSGSTAWVSFVQSHAWPRIVVGTLGLVTTVLVIALLFVGCTLAAGVVGGRPDRSLPAAFAPSLVPVALGYVVAHYYSLLVLEGQRALVRLSDPLGTGADWLGTAHLTPSSALVAPGIVANLQVAAIVLGHVGGVVLAHDRAVALFPEKGAVRGQLPLLALMVTLTCVGLLLLFWS
ncbi:MAG TPA: hypothetical protein VI248_06995 [Kineosporiaceae bacterium]